MPEEAVAEKTAEQLEAENKAAEEAAHEAAVKAAVSNPKTVPTKLTVARNISEETPNGNSYDFEQSKLKKKNKTDVDRFALVPVKPNTPEDYQKLLEFMGVKNAVLLAYQRLRGMSANWTNSAINKAGEFLESDFVKCVQEMSARGETIKALVEERAELMQEIIKLTQDVKIDPLVRLTKITEIGARLNTINETINFRQAENKEDAELATAADEADGSNGAPAAA